MGPNILVLDLETQSLFSDHADRKPESLGISVIGTYCYRTDQYRIYDESEIPALEQRLMEKPLVVGFNIRRFDMPVLKPYLHFDPATLQMLDILEILHTTLGHRVSLDSVAQATLGAGKSGDGLDAVAFYRAGAMDKLKQYCLDDIKVTRSVYEYGAAHSELFFTSKFGGGKKRVPVAWAIVHPDDAKVSAGEAVQMGLF